jgi:hypothetical protein
MIYSISDDFDFNRLSIHKPSLMNGSYIIKLFMDNNPFYLQLPESKIKAGVQKTSKKTHCDLIFNGENEKLLDWFEKFEIHCKKLLYDNRGWFDTDFEEDDIDNFFISILKSFKSGKFYTHRCYLSGHLGVFDENGENQIPFEDISNDTSILSIVEFIGIKCSDKHFQIETEIKQIVLMRKIFQKCLIKIQPKEMGKTEETGKMEETEKVEITKETEGGDSLKMDILRENNEDVDEEQKEEKKMEENKEEEKKEEKEEKEEETDRITETIMDEIKDLEKLNETVNLENLIDNDEPVKIKTRDDIYQKMYLDAKNKAKIVKKMALLAYLEAKRIKNEYMIDDIMDSENDEES